MAAHESEPDGVLVIVEPLSSGVDLTDAAHAVGLRTAWVSTFSREARVGPIGAFLPQTRDDLAAVIDYPLDRGEQFSDTGQDALRHHGAELASIISESLGDEVVGVVAGSEAGVTLADHVAAALCLPGNDPRRSLARRHKGDMKETAAASGIEVARHAICATAADVKGFLKETGEPTERSPVVAKTPCGSGSHGVCVCRSPAELSGHYTELRTMPDIFGFVPPHVLLEEFLVGREYAVNLFCFNSVPFVTDIWSYEKMRTPAGAIVYSVDYLETGRFEGRSTLEAFAISVANAYGILYGPAHVEVMLTPSPVLVEVSSRLAGGHMPHRVRDFSDFDPFRSTVRAFCGVQEPVPDSVKFSCEVGIVSCRTEESGRLLRIRGLDEIRRLSSYLADELNKAALNPVRPTSSAADCPLMVWLVAETRREIRRDAELVHALFSLETET